jgi:hypothetical protein
MYEFHISVVETLRSPARIILLFFMYSMYSFSELYFTPSIKLNGIWFAYKLWNFTYMEQSCFMWLMFLGNHLILMP